MLQCSLCKYATNNQRQQWKNYSVLFLVLYKDVLFHVCQSMQIICAICANQRIDIICDAFVREKFISSQTIAWPNQIQQLEIEISAKLTLIFVCFCRPLEPKSHVYTILLFVIIFHVHEHVLLKGKVSFDSNYCVICDNRTCKWDLFMFPSLAFLSFFLPRCHLPQLSFGNVIGDFLATKLHNGRNMD